MTTTIKAVLDGGEMKTLRGVVCGATEPVMYTRDRHQDKLMKASMRDNSGFITLLVFNQNVFDLIKKACLNQHVIKIDGYRRAETPKTLIIGTGTRCSLLTGRCLPLTGDEVDEARLAMYAPVQNLSQAKISPNKSRVSVKGRITKVLASSPSCKKVILQDLADQSESLITIWQPQQNIQAEVGQAMALYDARASAFNGGSIDTFSGTLIEVSDMEIQSKQTRGQMVGFGFEGDEEIVEIILAGEDNETTFHMTHAVLDKLKTMALPAELLITRKDNLITDANTIAEEDEDEVNEDELLNEVD